MRDFIFKPDDVKIASDGKTIYRVPIYDESGNPAGYQWRGQPEAQNPDEATPYDVAHVLQDSTAALYDLGPEAAVDDVFSKIGTSLNIDTIFEPGDTLTTLRTDLSDDWGLMDGSIFPFIDSPLWDELPSTTLGTSVYYPNYIAPEYKNVFFSISGSTLIKNTRIDYNSDDGSSYSQQTILTANGAIQSIQKSIYNGTEGYSVIARSTNPLNADFYFGTTLEELGYICTTTGGNQSSLYYVAGGGVYGNILTTVRSKNGTGEYIETFNATTGQYLGVSEYYNYNTPTVFMKNMMVRSSGGYLYITTNFLTLVETTISIGGGSSSTIIRAYEIDSYTIIYKYAGNHTICLNSDGTVFQNHYNIGSPLDIWKDVDTGVFYGLKSNGIIQSTSFVNILKGSGTVDIPIMNTATTGYIVGLKSIITDAKSVEKALPTYAGPDGFYTYLKMK